MTVAAFVKTLTLKQREALNILMRNPTAIQDIALLCGIKTSKPVDEYERRTALARSGKTSTLFSREVLARAEVQERREENNEIKIATNQIADRR